MTRVALPAGILLCVAVAGAWAMRDTLTPAVTVTTAPVLVRPPGGEADVPAEGVVVAQATGWTEGDPYEIRVSALTPGVIEGIPVRDGQAVKKGQVVATLVPDDARLAVQRAQAAVASRQADVRSAKAALTASQRDWDHPVERRRKVAVFAARLAEARAELRRLPAEIDEAAAYLAEQADRRKRVQDVFDRGAATELELTREKLRYKALQAKLQATRERGAILARTVERYQAELAAAREDLELRIVERQALDEAKADLARAEAEWQLARAALAEAELRLSRTSVRAPADGIVMRLLKAPGDKLMLGADRPDSAVVMDLYDPMQLQVRVDVPLGDAAKVSVGQPAEIVVHKLPDVTFAGRVTRVVREADIQKNTQEVKVRIEDPSEQLAPEMLSRVKFFSPPRPDKADPGPGSIVSRLFVPRRAVVDDGGQRSVYVIQPGEGRVRRAAVTVRGQGEWLQVVSGIGAGGQVVVDPPPALTDGDRVELIEHQATE